MRIVYTHYLVSWTHLISNLINAKDEKHQLCSVDNPVLRPKGAAECSHG